MSSKHLTFYLLWVSTSGLSRQKHFRNDEEYFEDPILRYKYLKILCFDIKKKCGSGPYYRLLKVSTIKNVTGCSLNIAFFVIFLNSASSAAALVVYLSGVRTHTDTKRKQSKTRVWNILKSFEKNTMFNEHPV